MYWKILLHDIDDHIKDTESVNFLCNKLQQSPLVVKIGFLENLLHIPSYSYSWLLKLNILTLVFVFRYQG